MIESGERKTGGGMFWKAAFGICALLLAAAAVAIVVLAVDRGGGEDKALQDKATQLEEEIRDMEQEISDLQAQLASAEAGKEDAEAEKEEEAASTPSDRDQLKALGEQMIDEDVFYVGEIVIDGDWARVGLAAKDPTTHQGDLAYFHKVDGQWTLVDVGTGLTYGDIPGAPESIFP